MRKHQRMEDSDLMRSFADMTNVVCVQTHAANVQAKVGVPLALRWAFPCDRRDTSAVINKA